jgi:hypothetical protein
MMPPPPRPEDAVSLDAAPNLVPVAPETEAEDQPEVSHDHVGGQNGLAPSERQPLFDTNEIEADQALESEAGDDPTITQETPETVAANEEIAAAVESPAEIAASTTTEDVDGSPDDVDDATEDDETGEGNLDDATEGDETGEGNLDEAVDETGQGDVDDAVGETQLDIRDTPPPPPPPPVPEPDPAPETTPRLQPEPKLLLSALPPADGDSRLILGTVQVPDRPNPAIFAMNLPRDGSLGLVGPSGSGRTSALQSVAAATAMLTVAPDAVPIVYYLDVPGELDVLKVLPNAVGAARNDIDGFRSVTADLERLLIDRRAAFDELGAGNLDEYRHLQPGANLRRIVTLIDNISAFGELMEALQPGRFIALLKAMLSDGPALGVHLVFTGNDHNDLGQMLGRQVGRWLTLGGGGPEEVIRPGRAMVGQNEVRFAVVGSSDPAQAITNVGAKLLANGATPINSPSGPVQAAG